MPLSLRCYEAPFPMPAPDDVVAAWRRDPEALAWALPPPPLPEALKARSAALAKGPARTALAERLLAEHRRLGAPAATLEACARLGKAGALTVVAGQQPAPGLGPLYSLHKAAAAISLARKWDAIPVFWIAGDDQDLEEAARVRFLAAGGGLEELRAPVPAALPLNRLETDAALRDWLAAWRDKLPPSDYRDPLFAKLAEACRGTWSDWMGRTLLDLFGVDGLVVLDPSWVRKESADLLKRYAAGASSFSEAMATHSAKLQASGFRLQVSPMPSFHLFTEKGGSRRRAEAFDDDASPDVLLRPVLQDALLPSLAMIAGSGEAAYLAQAGPLYEGLGVSRPLLALRPPLTLLPARQAERLAAWGLSPADALLPEEALLEAARKRNGAKQDLTLEIRALAPRWEADLKALALPPDLARPREKTLASVKAALEALGRHAAKAEDAAAGIDRAQVDSLRRWAFPGAKPQERVLNAASVLARFGPELAEALTRLDWTDPRPRVAVVS